MAFRAGTEVEKMQEDPFELFISSTKIRYCYYADTHKVRSSHLPRAIALPPPPRASPLAASHGPPPSPCRCWATRLRGADAEPAGANDRDGGGGRGDRAAAQDDVVAQAALLAQHGRARALPHRGALARHRALQRAVPA
eukprot:508614-Rhodomonas_salina.3